MAVTPRPFVYGINLLLTDHFLSLPYPKPSSLTSGRTDRQSDFNMPLEILSLGLVGWEGKQFERDSGDGDAICRN